MLACFSMLLLLACCRIKHLNKRLNYRKCLCFSMIVSLLVIIILKYQDWLFTDYTCFANWVIKSAFNSIITSKLQLYFMSGLASQQPHCYMLLKHNEEICFF